MIDNFGIGIDIVNVERFRKIPYEREILFYNRIFTKNEIDYCLKFSDPYVHFAGKFAVKEAVKKSMNHVIDLLDIETFHENNKPKVKISNQNTQFLVSISHDGDFSIAVVVVISFQNKSN